MSHSCYRGNRASGGALRVVGFLEAGKDKDIVSERPGLEENPRPACEASCGESVIVVRRAAEVAAVPM